MVMCRNIRNLYNFEPAATEKEIQDAALQFVRKVSGTTKPSSANQQAFELAIKEVAESVNKLLDNMVTTGLPKNRDVEAAKARARSIKRFGNQNTAGVVS